MRTALTPTASAPAGDAAPQRGQMSVLTLAGLVVGSVVGAGVFSLPGQFAQTTGVLGTLLVWAIAGVGMLSVALVFATLATRRPDLDSGVYAYARAGFGSYPGFLSAFGYWASACGGNVTYWVLISATLSTLFPSLGAGNTLSATLLSSAGIWLFHALVSRGVREAAALNRVVTAAKVVPLALFLVLAAFAFDADIFIGNLSVTGQGSLFDQLRNTMLVTVFVFMGIEGASVYSRHARRRSDVGRATVLGYLAVLAVFASVTIVSFGVVPRGELAAMEPSTAGVLEAAYGAWGGTLISVGLIVSVLGAYLAWTLMAAEVMSVAATEGEMPAALGRPHPRTGVPTRALLMSSGMVQVLVILVHFSEDAFNFSLSLTSSLLLVPLTLSAAYAVKLALTGETYADEPGRRRRDLAIASVALLYTLFLLVAAGWQYLLVTLVVYLPSSILFVMARRERGERAFVGREIVVLALGTAGALVGVWALATGAITI